MLDKRVCSICAWRQHCQKRFTVATDVSFNVNCPDYTRDVTIKDVEVENRVVEYQLERWQRAVKPTYEFVITIARQTGAGGSEIARRLAEELSMDLIGGQIIQRVAQSSRMSTKVVETLDEKAVTRVDNMINSLFASRHLSPDVYLRHLSRVIATIGEHGNAVIVGRGANFILPKNKTLRIRIIAPLEYRVEHFMKTRGLTKSETLRYVEKRDADRVGYIKKYFKADPNDSIHYDMVINTEMLGIEGAAKAVLGALQDRIKIAAAARKATVP
jgi:cytidylate kinase